MRVKSREVRDVILSFKVYKKWQEITDFLARVMDIPAALIMYHDDEYMEVFIASKGENNPYKPGDKEKWNGLYCEKVVKSNEKLNVPNALKDNNWDKNPDIKLGMIAYLGFPINFPDDTPFGTICVLDNKERQFSEEQQQLLVQYKNIIEHDLIELLFFSRKEKVLNNHISKQLIKINEKENYVKAMLDSWIDAYFRADLEGTIMLVNKAAVDMFGFDSEAQMLGHNKSELYVKKEDLHNLLNELKVSQKVKDWNCEGKRKDGSQFWMSVNIQYLIEKNKIIGTEGFIRDITDRKKAEQELYYKNQEIQTINEELKATAEALMENDELLRKISENYPNSYISVIEKDLTIGLTTGQEFKNQHLNPDGFIGLSLKEVFGDQEPIVRKHYLETFMGKETTFELFMDNQYQLYKTVPLYDNRNAISRILVVAENITTLKNIQNELIDAKEKAEESNRLKTAFLHNLSHEIRTPMNGIIGFSNMLINPNLSREKQESYSQMIKSSTNQLLRIIDDIIEISSLETHLVSPEKEIINLNDLLQDLVSLFKMEAIKKDLPIIVTNGLSDKESQIVSDSSIISKILNHLIENAIKFTNEGTIMVGYVKDANKINIYVKDTGVGISTENQKLIFERFSQEEKTLSRKHGGLGLGLSISKENARLLGGEIYVESEKGTGSSFYLSIPYIKPDPQEEIMQAIVEQPGKLSVKEKSSYKVLVAEDEDSVFIFLNEVLTEITDLEFIVLHARDGNEAVELCDKNTDIDFILMDIKMPNMNGYDATRIIKSKYPTIPVIVQTAYATRADKQMAFDYGCDDYISKPIDEEKLKMIINKFKDVINKME